MLDDEHSSVVARAGSAASSLTACAKQALPGTTEPTAERRPVRESKTALSWGIPRFFEVGRQVQIDADTPPVDTTGWPDALLRAAGAAPRAYLSASADDQSRVFVYPEPDPSLQVRRYALVVPEPKTFSTNGVVTAFWGHSPQLMNFAPGAARSFASFSRATPGGARQVIPLRARLATTGVNHRSSRTSTSWSRAGSTYSSTRAWCRASRSFLEFTVYDRDATTDDAEPRPVESSSLKATLSVALMPLRDASWLRRESFETNGYRVLLVGDAAGDSYFLAAPLELRPGWGFGEVNTDLTLGQLDVSAERTRAQARPRR